MTPYSRPETQAKAILVQVAGLLSESELKVRVLEPFERAAHHISVPHGGITSTDKLLDYAAGFLRRLYEDAIHITLNPQQARDEIVDLFQKGWPGGFMGAVHDATDPHEGDLAMMMQYVVRSIAVRYATSYIRWTLGRHVESCDWHTRCRMAEILVQITARWTPEPIHHRDARLWAGQIHRLLELAITSGSLDLSNG